MEFQQFRLETPIGVFYAFLNKKEKIMSRDYNDLWSDINNPNNDANMDDWSDAHNDNNDTYYDYNDEDDH